MACSCLSQHKVLATLLRFNNSKWAIFTFPNRKYSFSSNIRNGPGLHTCRGALWVEPHPVHSGCPPIWCQTPSPHASGSSHAKQTSDSLVKSYYPTMSCRQAPLKTDSMKLRKIEPGGRPYKTMRVKFCQIGKLQFYVLEKL